MESTSRMSEHRDTRISVVIPAHNEAKNLQYVLPHIPHWIHEVILVNDHSTDQTVEVAYELLPTIRIINTERGRGKGAALQTGFAAGTWDFLLALGAGGCRGRPRMTA